MQRSVLVIGASTGIGAYLSCGLSEDGSTVYSMSRRPENEWENTGSSEKIRIDISDSANFNRVISQKFTQESFPRNIINCVGLGGGQLFMATNASRWREDFEANFLQPLNAQNELIKKASAYKIPLVSIMFSSLATEVIQTGNSLYGASKVALTRAHKGMALEYQKFGHLCYTLSPSLIENTPMADNLPENIRSSYQNHLIFDAINPDEILQLVKFLIDNRPKSLSGTTIQIGGTR